MKCFFIIYESEFNGRTIIYYSLGCQRGIEFLAEAAYEGQMKDFLQGFFD